MYRKILFSIGIVALLGGIAGFATYSAFSGEAPSSANVFQAGTVSIGSNDAGSALYSVTNQEPGSTVSNCIRVTYNGTLDADVRMYAPDTIGALGEYVTLTVTPGTQETSTFPSCSGFTADAGGSIFSGTLASFASAHSSWANGLADHPGTTTKWAQGNSVVYQFTLTLQDTNAANAGASPGLSTGQHRIAFEARNQ